VRVSQPVVSVVIPSYQHRAFVRRAVESTLEQSFRDLEVIVVDDASTDGTADEVERIADPRLRLYRQTENRAEHVRNKAIRLARGRYIAFQNSDDEWHETKLEKQLALLEAKQNAAACFTAVDLIDERSHPCKKTWMDGAFFEGRTARSADDWLRVLFSHNELCISSAVVRRSVLEQVGLFRENLVQLSDMDMWIRMASVGDLEVLPERLTRMRILGGRNLSAPSSSAGNRMVWEQSELLGNFICPPLVGRLEGLFPEAGIDKEDTRPVRLARFALLCMTRGTSYRLFANRVLTDLMHDSAAATGLRNVFGSRLIKAYWQNRSELAVDIKQPPRPSGLARTMVWLKDRMAGKKQI